MLFVLCQDVILRLALGARGMLNPMCAAMGGIVGQEVLKACSGKFRWVRRLKSCFGRKGSFVLIVSMQELVSASAVTSVVPAGLSNRACYS